LEVPSFAESGESVSQSGSDWIGRRFTARIGFGEVRNR
jgi:hypothetical protein